MELVKRMIANISNCRITVICIACILAAMSIVMLIISKFVLSDSEAVAVTDETVYSDFSDFDATGSVYDIENIVTANGFKYYYEDGILRSRIGIDVSYAQKEIDWDRVAASGIEFAMIRLGYRGYETGYLNIDEYFTKNISGAAAAGIDVGVYFFSQAISAAEAVEEAEFVAEHIKEYDITYPVVFDWEPVTDNPARTDGISGGVLNECALAFCETISTAGYKPVIYASLNLLRKQYGMYDVEKISKYDLWLAEYKDYPEYPYNFKMWQYSSSAHIDGINYATDINVYFDTQ